VLRRRYGGARVDRTSQETGVDRVVVERESSVVRIVGRSREAVQAARRQLEMLSVSVPVPRDRFGYLVGKNGSNLEALKAKTGVATLQVRV